MKSPSLSAASWVLFGVILFIFFFGLSNWDIYILDEAKNAEAAREMMASQDWIVPRFNGALRYDKPPLHYYFFSLSYSIFGVNAFAARFFPALMGCVLAFSVFFKIKSRLGEQPAFWSTLLFVSSLHVQMQFKLSVPDPFLIGFLTFSVFSVESWIRSGFAAKTHFRWAMVFLALATLSKGPVAPVLFFATLAVYFLVVPKGFRQSAKILDPVAILIFLAITLPWYLAVAWVTEGDWLQEFVFHHNLNRFSKPMEGHGGPFYLTFLMIVGGFLPGSFLLFRLFSLRRKELLNDPLILLSCIFALVTLVFFSFSSTKLPNYTAPVYPFLAVMVAYCLDFSGRISRFDFAAIALAGLVPIGAIGFSFGILPDLPELEGLDSFAPAMLIPVVLGLGVLVILFSRKLKPAIFTLSLAYLSFNALLVSLYLPAINRHNPLQNSQQLWEGKQLYFWGEFNPAFPFASQQILFPWEGQTGVNDLIITTDRALQKQPFTSPYEVIYQSRDLFEKTNTLIIRPVSAEK